MMITNSFTGQELDISCGSDVWCGDIAGNPENPNIEKVWADIDEAAQKELKQIALKAEELMERAKVLIGL